MTELYPRPGQIEAALRLVHERRRRSARATAAAVLMTVALLWPGIGRATAVLVSESPVRVAAAVPPRYDGEYEAPKNGAERTPPPPSRPTPGGYPVTAPAFAAAPAPPDPIDRERAERLRARRTVVKTKQGGSCLDAGWCSAPEVRRHGETLVLHYTVCGPNDGPGTLSYDDEQEFDVVVATRWQALWRWSHHVSLGPGAHVLEVPGGRCWRWRVAWDGTLDDGSRIRPGQYDLYAWCRCTPELPLTVVAFTVR